MLYLHNCVVALARMLWRFTNLSLHGHIVFSNMKAKKKENKPVLRQVFHAGMFRSNAGEPPGPWLQAPFPPIQRTLGHPWGWQGPGTLRACLPLSLPIESLCPRDFGQSDCLPAGPLAFEVQACFLPHCVGV